MVPPTGHQLHGPYAGTGMVAVGFTSMVSSVAGRADERGQSFRVDVVIGGWRLNPLRWHRADNQASVIWVQGRAASAAMAGSARAQVDRSNR